MCTCTNIIIVKGSMKKRKLVKGTGSDGEVRSDKICQDLRLLGALEGSKGSSNGGVGGAFHEMRKTGEGGGL